jgi:hypothetical protein
MSLGELSNQIDGQVAAAQIAEAARIVEVADQCGVPLRLMGGVGVALVCPSATSAPLARAYSDLDFVGRGSAGEAIDRVFGEVGYEADQEFNALHGEERLSFVREDAHADVFLDRIRACHVLDLRERLELWPRSVPPGDLLLSKLQIVKTTEKDMVDIVALVLDHELTADDSGINVTRLTEVCAADWGWWRTVTGTTEKAIANAEGLAPSEIDIDLAVSRLRQILAALDEAPKSRRWKLRSRVGEKVAWYEEPEDPDR